LTASLKSQFLRFLGVKGVKFQISSFWPPQGTSLDRTTYRG